jgi:hypothetical protein
MPEENETKRKPKAKKAGTRAAKKSANGAKRSSSSATLGNPWTFPKYPLEKAIEVAQSLEEKNAGKPLRSADLAPILGFKRVEDWRYLDLLRAANQYGLVTGSGSAATIELTPLGQDIVAPSSPAQRQKALLAAFQKVEVFKNVAEFYSGKRIPEDEFFGNTLVRDFSVPRERVPTFIEIFTGNLGYLNAFAANTDGAPVVAAAIASGGIDGPSMVAGGDGDNVREFLDTCFVMMPFGEWFDRYYKDIYVPAIKEAGFEPLRADSLFNSGSVIEQIWLQIRKAKVLLADLTGKNPNVFYELGLAHAARKPVVFVSGNIEDVPFDVRHLRVVTFDVREPSWSDRLRRDITAYLKSARAEPERTIPQPFRDGVAGESELDEEIPASRRKNLGAA